LTSRSTREVFFAYRSARYAHDIVFKCVTAILKNCRYRTGNCFCSLRTFVHDGSSGYRGAKFKRKLNGIARRKFVAFAFARDLSPLKINR